MPPSISAKADSRSATSAVALPINYWKSFWSSYGPRNAVTENDLFRQVAHTVNKQPISKSLFLAMMHNVQTTMDLSREDHVIDLCCGNGLFTYDIGRRVGAVTGIDFVERNIETAKRWKSLGNTSFVVGDVTTSFDSLIGSGVQPNKFTMLYSLGYFAPDQLDTIVASIKRLRDVPFRFGIIGIPSAELKWNYYDTPERRARHIENEKAQKDINEGMGRWWDAAEIAEVCSRHGLRARVSPQPAGLSNYRMDAIITP